MDGGRRIANSLCIFNRLLNILVSQFMLLQTAICQTTLVMKLGQVEAVTDRMIGSGRMRQCLGEMAGRRLGARENLHHGAFPRSNMKGKQRSASKVVPRDRCSFNECIKH